MQIETGRFVLDQQGWLNTPTMTLLVLVAVLLGYFGGSAAGHLLRGISPLQGFGHSPKAVTAMLLMSLAAGIFATYFFTSREQLAQTRLAHEEAQRQASEAQLKLLQSQLEPHMLFNTLANLRALIGLEPDRAQVMLDHVVAYLRATLSASRAPTHPLQAEFDRLHDYLEIMAVRMGPRLHYSLDLPPELAQYPVPPLILQPLVENAIKHGLEPKVEGGRIRVQACCEAGRITLEVQDTGVGLPPGCEPVDGFGLAQVRERLATTYGSQGAIELVASHASGVRSIVTFPINFKTPCVQATPPP
jgi:LytS/YehU family sensor histidine kinase